MAWTNVESPLSSTASVVEGNVNSAIVPLDNSQTIWDGGATVWDGGGTKWDFVPKTDIWSDAE